MSMEVRFTQWCTAPHRSIPVPPARLRVSAYFHWSLKVRLGPTDRRVLSPPLRPSPQVWWFNPSGLAYQALPDRRDLPPIRYTLLDG